MIRINEILDKISPYMSDKDLALIQKAYVYSAAAHAGQIRLSGEPYLSHPLEVTNILAELHLDAPTIAAGLLHDTVEDTKTTIEEIKGKFGREVADIVQGVTKIGKMSFDSREEAQAENIRKMILAMAEDIRVLMVKLADRLHNMKTLEHQKPIKRRLVAQETLDIYSPLANRLGLHRLKVQLEDLSLKYLKPDFYEQVAQGVQKHQTAGQEYIAKVIKLIEDLLKKNKIKARVFGRTKHLYSIYEKMLQQGLTLDEIYDLIAFRIVTGNVKDCYAVLGLVHSIWRPVPGRFKDYISMPKANMYQSLHTTVVGPDGERIEIQIRTEEMHEIAEYGVASHWMYKETDKGKPKRPKGLSAKELERFSWLRQILDWQNDLKDSKDFMRSLKMDLFHQEVYVFTPAGQVKELPEGATPIDFAYSIHTEVGDHCAGAKVDGRLVPLNTPLKNGVTVEIITDSNRHPSRDWLKFVKTAKARTRVKYWIRTEERARSIALGKEMLEKQGRKKGVNIAKQAKEGRLDEIAREFSFRSADDLYSSIGYARVTPTQVINRLLPREPEVRRGPEEQAQAREAEAKPTTEGVSVKGVDDVLVRFSKCCNPLPGDPIVGYITRGRGVTIHTMDCPNVAGMEPERMLSVSWEDADKRPYPAKIRVSAKNVKGVLAKISALLAEKDVNIDSGTFRSNVEGNTELLFTVEVRGSDHLYNVINEIRKLGEVIEVGRLTLGRKSKSPGKLQNTGHVHETH